MSLDVYKNEAFLPKKQKRENVSGGLVCYLSLIFSIWATLSLLIGEVEDDIKIFFLIIAIAGGYMAFRLWRSAIKNFVYTREGISLYHGRKLLQEINYRDVDHLKVSISPMTNAHKVVRTHSMVKNNLGTPKVTVYNIEMYDNNGLQLFSSTATGEHELNTALFLITADHPHLRESAFEMQGEDSLIRWIEEQETFYRDNKEIYFKSKKEIYFSTLLKTIIWMFLITVLIIGIALVIRREPISIEEAFTFFLIVLGGLEVLGIMFQYCYYLILVNRLPQR